MADNNMEHNSDSPIGIVLSLGSIILYVFSKITLSDVAAMGAIFSGFVGGLYWLTRWILLLRSKKDS